MNITELKEDIIKFGKLLYSKNFSPATSGNISVRYGENFLISSSGSCLGFLEYDDIVMVNSNGNVIEGNKKASSEKFLHIKAYEQRPDINSIFHVHSPKATALAIAGVELLAPFCAELVYYFGEIKLAKYATPSSLELVEKTIPFLKNSNAVLMQNHGLLVCAKSIKEAFFGVESIENYAQNYIDAKILGCLTLLSKKSLQEIQLLKSGQ